VAETIFQSAAIPHASDWSRDGHWIIDFELIGVAGGRPNRDLWLREVTPDGKLAPGAKPIPWATEPFGEKLGRFEPFPNPRWIAYQSDETGRFEIYVDACPTRRAKVRISTGGGQYPEWSADGREIFYVSPEGALMAVSLRVSAAEVVPGQPHELFRFATTDLDTSPFQVAPDGKRFLVRMTAATAPQPLSIIVNWPALLKK
jgi:hypothetical protein